MRHSISIKGGRLAAIILFIVAMGSGPVAVFMNPTVSSMLGASVDFSAITGKTVVPVWRAYNVWDVTSVPGLLSNLTEFKVGHPDVTTLDLMTATGGRDAQWKYSNDYVQRYSNETLHYDFTNLTKAIDPIVADGFKLILVIGNVPQALVNRSLYSMADYAKAFSPSDYGGFDALTLPPANYTEYSWYIGNLTHAMISRYGLAEVSSSWQFRLMTEPDNKAWWTGTPDDYVQLWLSTFGPLKTQVPEAHLILGNMAWHDNFTFAQNLLLKVKAVNATLLPDTVSFSYYHNLEHPSAPDDLSNLVQVWSAFVTSLDLGKHIDVAVEEGMILVDEHGVRLWDNDGTELGGAWEGWMISSVEGLDFENFVQWDMSYYDHLETTGFVQQAAQRMAGSALVPLDLGYTALIPPSSFMHLAGGFAAKNASTGMYQVLLYQYTPDRSWNHTLDISLSLSSLPAGQYTLNEYWIDHTHNNWFTSWLQVVAADHLVPPKNGSIYDDDIGTAFNWSPGMAAAWGQWLSTHPVNNTLVPTTKTGVTIGSNGLASLSLQFGANAVVLVEFQKS